MSTLTHLRAIRQAMPATTAHIYLNTGTFGPLPRSVIKTMQDHMLDEWSHGRLGKETFDTITTVYSGARQRVASLLNATESEITLTDNTGEGMNIISYGIDWHSGDEVITTNHEHISALAPLYQIRDRFGIKIHIADLGPTAEKPVRAAIEELITQQTRLIVLSHVTWTTGTPLDVHAIGALGRERNIPVLVDGAQSAGSIPIDVKALAVDFYAIPMQKWLCGPDGTGALYVRQEALRFIAPTYVGYWSTKHEEGIEWELNDGATRFELGGRQTAAVAGQQAVLTWLEDFVGYPWLFERIAHLHTYAYNKLRDIPSLTVLTPKPGGSGILSFQLAGYDDAALVTYLQDTYNIFTRNIPGTGTLRISTGFYNTEEEIDTLVYALSHLPQDLS